MVGAGNDHQFLRFGESVDYSLQFRARSEFITVSADEQLGLRATAQKFEIVISIVNGRDWQTEANDSSSAWVRTRRTQPHCSAERKPGKNQREMKFAVQPIKRSPHILHFAIAMGMLALTKPGATKIKSQHGISKAIQRLHGMKNYFVVQRPTVKRVRMTDQSSMRRPLRTHIEQGFQATSGTVKKKGFDSGWREHGIQITWLVRAGTECVAPAAHSIAVALFSLPMDVVALTRQLVDIESITGNEAQVGVVLHRELCRLGYQADKIPVEGNRCNVYATSKSSPTVVLSTHMDTVPPFIPSSEDETRIYGRGSCDAKGIIAAQIAAAERLRAEGIHVGLLFVVGEERDSLGAKLANQNPPGCKFLINGEPTENRLATASKGTLRVNVTAYGRMAHSAYPELGESAINKLLEALNRLRSMKLPTTDGIGPSTLNIGVIEGGRAPNVIPDYARAQLLYRLVGPADDLRREIQRTVGDLAKVEFVLEIPFLRLRTLDGLPTMVAAFTTDVPFLTHWGQPLLVGPGSIHVAHTDGEYIEKEQLSGAVDLYRSIVKKLVE